MTKEKDRIFLEFGRDVFEEDLQKVLERREAYMHTLKPWTKAMYGYVILALFVAYLISLYSGSVAAIVGILSVVPLMVIMKIWLGISADIHGTFRQTEILIKRVKSYQDQLDILDELVVNG